MDASARNGRAGHAGDHFKVKSDAEKPTILIIDDDEHVRSLLATLFADEYECINAASGEDALALLAKREFDLVITDINMGGISGLDLLPQVHRYCPDTVVVMVSGEKTIEDAIEAMQGGAFDYV